MEYTAERVFGRFGAVISCRMKYAEDAIPEGMSKKKYKRMKWLSMLIFPVLVCIYFIATREPKLSNTGEVLAIALMLVVALIPYYLYFHNFK